MSQFGGIPDFLARLLGLRRTEAPARPTTPWGGVPAARGPQQVINDAVAYGVSVEPATVTPGGWYWQATRVHHLTPEENGGNHHIYLDVLEPKDPAHPDSLARLYNARLKVTWSGGEQIVTVDKPLSEPGANFPMWKWQVCAVQALGLPGQELPSDRVVGMHTGHPDEAPGNTLFHHSFSVTFCKVQAPSAVYADSVIYGIIRGAQGRSLALLRDGEVLARLPIGSDGSFRFTDLAAGEYVLAVEGTSFRSEPVKVNGQDQARLDLELVLAESSISGRVKNGAGRSVRLLRDGTEVAVTTVAPDESYRFAGLTAGTYQVALADALLMSERVILDGTNSVTVDLVSPASGKPVAHYVLFGPPRHPATEVNLLLAMDFLLAFKPSFGFSSDQAGQAGIVTIIADPSGVSPEVEARLASEGALVQRIAGSDEEVAAALAARVASGKLFG